MHSSILLCVLALLALAYSQSHDLRLGRINYGDVVLYEVNEYKHGFPLLVKESIVEYPVKENGHVRPYITAIIVRDNDKDGYGGYPSILAGGVGQNFVRIQLKSQRNYGYNFTVIIYGRYV